MRHEDVLWTNLYICSLFNIIEKYLPTRPRDVWASTNEKFDSDHSWITVNISMDSEWTILPYLVARKTLGNTYEGKVQSRFRRFIGSTQASVINED